MPDDLRLPYIDGFTAQGLPLPGLDRYFKPAKFNQGYLQCRHQWLPPTGTFGGPTNSLTYGLRVRTSDVKQALISIIGYPVKADGSGFDRLLPICDPDGFGMFATEVSVRGYEGKSGFIKLEINNPESDTPVVGVSGAAPDGRVWNNKIADGFDTTFPITLDPGVEKLLCVYEYVLLSVKFEHVMYYVASNDIIDSDPLGERDRFTIWNYIPGIEYVSLDSNTLTWLEGPVAGTTVGKGAGFVRATGELKCQWFGIPAASLGSLIRKWLGIGTVNGVQRKPINGKTNDDIFTVDITNLNDLLDFPAETLLMQPPRTMIRPRATGFRMYDVEMSLTHRPEGWNKFLYWPTGEYLRAAYSPPVPALNRPVYELIDFEEAFTN